MTTLCILLGLAFIIALQIALSLRDDRFNQRVEINRLTRANKELSARNYRLISEATVLNGERDYLAGRNVVLEAESKHRECLQAAGTMFVPGRLGVGEKMIAGKHGI